MAKRDAPNLSIIAPCTTLTHLKELEMKSIIICQFFCVAILVNAKPTENESNDIGDVMREVAKDVNTALVSKTALVGYDLTSIIN